MPSYLINGRCSWYFPAASATTGAKDKKSTCWLLIRLSPNLEPSDVLMAITDFLIVSKRTKVDKPDIHFFKHQQVNDPKACTVSQ